MENPQNIKLKILEILKSRGPSLPVHVARETNLSSIFASAFLSELLNEKSIKISHMRVGGSPLYFLKTQESQLEKFYQYLPGKEKEAFLLLKEKSILKDSLLPPPIRVALRNLGDFAIPFRKNEEVFWKYFLYEEPAEKQEIEKKPEREKEKQEKVTTTKSIEKPLIEIKPQKKKIKNEQANKFLEEVKNFLIKKDIELLEEISIDKKEIIGKIRINSDLGKIIFLLIAKDKKRVTEADIIKSYQTSIDKKMPCYLLSKGELSKKIKELLLNYKNILKVDKI